MAVSVLRRAAEPRSPERERLREAVAQHQAEAARLERMRTAAEQSRRDSVDRMIAVTAAEDALAEAKEAEPRRRVAQLLGESDVGGPTVADAQRALDEARNEHEIARSATAILQQAINGGGETSFTQGAVDRALVALLDADPAVDALVEAFDASRARTEALAAVLSFIRLTRLPERHQLWQATNRALPPIEPLVPAWKDALDALLRGEADTPLPSLESRG